jgi:hypothetical protein
MTLIQETSELDRLALDVSSPDQRGDVVLGLVVIRPAESTWGRIAAGEQAVPAHRVDFSVNQLQVTAGSLGYTPVKPLDSVVGHACLLSPNPARLSVALPGRGGVRSWLLKFSQISHRST